MADMIRPRGMTFPVCPTCGRVVIDPTNCPYQHPKAGA